MEQTVTAAKMKAAEAAANAAGYPYLAMMERAAEELVAAILEERPELRTAAVLVGKGNNGGDGLAAARLLKEKGVHVLLVLAEGKPTAPDALTNLYRAAMLDIPLVLATCLTEEDIGWITACGCVIDGVCGTGFHGELGLEAGVCCGLFNQCKGLKVSIDVPTGVECDTGAADKDRAKPELTVTFQAAKPCHSLTHCGKVAVRDIGLGQYL